MTNSAQLKIPYKPVVLVVLDGFGVGIRIPESTWASAQRPTFEELERNYPFFMLQASGIAVGLPWGQEGNSEVGHLTMGAGKIIYHHLPRIIVAIQDGSFFKNDAFAAAFAKAKEKGSGLHLMGLFSSGTVHAYIDHLYALLELAKQNSMERVWIHAFTDGKDAPLQEAAKGLKILEERLVREYPFAAIASVVGRRFAMDRDGHWDRIETAYRMFAEGKGNAFLHAAIHVERCYENGQTDESIAPGFLGDEHGNAKGRIHDDDAVIFYNFREDSARELTQAFVNERFDGFARPYLRNLLFVTMTEYEKGLPALVAFPPIDVAWPLARVISEAGLRQLHVAETEKYAHVTYFFNGGREQPFPGEERMLIASPRTVHVDDAPEMSAAQITDTVIHALGTYDFILVNFANADMVGHTGNFDATVQAIESLDLSIGKIVSRALEAGGAVVITADHGNAEEKRYGITGEKRTKHSTNPVPCYLVARELKQNRARSAQEIIERYQSVDGVLTDVAPTVVALAGLTPPAEMTGKNLLM